MPRTPTLAKILNNNLINGTITIDNNEGEIQIINGEVTDISGKINWNSIQIRTQSHGLHRSARETPFHPQRVRFRGIATSQNTPGCNNRNAKDILWWSPSWQKA